MSQRKDWQQAVIYPQVINSSPYAYYNTNQCDLYTSLYRMLVMNYGKTLAVELATLGFVEYLNFCISLLMI